ncbi:hypothetical protein [Calothrix sp. NIES-3974]|nr:hypothetical protein [Calothrix sp. NIES-3974]BAZ04107.1 hypothetical protein NIES3974_07370 [Calothrix sp. NIES-3974]
MEASGSSSHRLTPVGTVAIDEESEPEPEPANMQLVINLMNSPL